MDEAKPLRIVFWVVFHLRGFTWRIVPWVPSMWFARFDDPLPSGPQSIHRLLTAWEHLQGHHIEWSAIVEPRRSVQRPICRAVFFPHISQEYLPRNTLRTSFVQDFPNFFDLQKTSPIIIFLHQNAWKTHFWLLEKHKVYTHSNGNYL